MARSSGPDNTECDGSDDADQDEHGHEGRRRIGGSLGVATALDALRAEGVLVLASGSMTHNLALVFGAGRPPLDAPEVPQSAAFRSWFAERSAAADWPALLDYRAQAPHAALMHPSDEHLLPWYVAAGAGHEGPALRVHDSLTYGCLGMDAYAFGTPAPALQAALAATPALH